MKSFPVITCALCGVRVANMQVYFDVTKRVFKVLVQCHGHIEQTEFPEKLFEDGWSIVEAKAFGNETSFKVAGPKEIETVVGEIVGVEEVTSKTNFPVVKFTEKELEDSWQIRKKEIEKGKIPDELPLCCREDKFNHPTGTWALGFKEAI